MQFLKHEPKIVFLGRRRQAVIISALLITISIASLGFRGLAFGIDLSGGTLVEVAYDDIVQTSEVREILDRAGFPSAVVQYFGTAKDILVRLPASVVENAAEVSSAIMVALRERQDLP